MSSSFTRAYQRFLVNNVDFLTGKILGAERSLRLTTLGMGGCSFCGFEADMNLVPPAKCKTSLQYEDGTEQQIEGRVIYVRPEFTGNLNLIHYGVEFSPAERFQIAPLIARLQGLADAKKVDYA